MKGCIGAAVVLCAVILLAAVNAVYVRRVSDELLSSLESLPELPDPAATPDQVAEIVAYLDKHTPYLSLSVNFNLSDRISESLAALEAHARLGDRYQYAATIAILCDLCRDLSRAEQFSLENIF